MTLAALFAALDTRLKREKTKSARDLVRMFALKGPAGFVQTDTGQVLLFRKYGEALVKRRAGERVAPVAVPRSRVTKGVT